MKNAFQVALLLMLGVGLCAGCGKSEKTDAKPAEAAQTENWEPESVELPDGHTMDDGHDHGAHGHGGHDH